MPRITRAVNDGFVYHVLNRGNGKQEIFRKVQDYNVFIEIMKEAKARYSIRVFAYCLMPNHFHIVLMPILGEDLSKWMQWLMTTHVRRYHRHYGTSGHIWQGRFKSFLIKKDVHLIRVLRYVESNPVRAGLVGSAKDWMWSSHREVIGERPHLLVDNIPVELPQEWDKYVDKPLEKRELGGLRQSVARQSPYGNLSWRLRVSKKFGLESTLRPRGRPVKRIERYDKK